MEDKLLINNDNDIILNVFINTFVKNDIECPITLNVGGLIICGIIISPKKYFSMLAEQFGEGNQGAMFFQEMFTKLADVYIEDNDTDEDYIHLKSTRILSNGNDINLGIWRGKVSSIDGFTFGTLEYK